MCGRARWPYPLDVDSAAPSRRLRPPLPDVALAVAFTAAALAITSAIGNDERQQERLDALAIALIVVAGASLAWRRIAPEVAVVVSTLSLSTYAFLDYQGGPVYLTPLIVIYTLASVEGRRRSVPYAVGSAVALLLAAAPHTLGNGTLLPHLLYLSWAVGAVLLGDAVHNRRTYLLSLEERARYLEETRDEEARRRVAEERLRIARDLHDVVAHSLASINIQSGAGLHVIDRHPDQASDALLAIKQASKQALDELRTTLDMLRDDGEAPRSPTPGLGDLAMLTAGAERAGVPVEISVTGAVRRLPPALDLTAYRIIQESLTNVMRHAGPAKACISVEYTPEAIDIEVVDDGVGPSGTNGTAGHGMRGMRERATVVGGRIEAGRGVNGGFKVSAHLPNGTGPA